jgi:uncharacterized cupredoxin-like copper-binding protein
VVRAFGPSDLLRRARLPAEVAAVLLVAGCGGGGQGGGGSGPQTSTASPPATGVVLSLTGTEYSFTPSVLTASAGKTTIRFTNGGAVDHDFTLDAPPIHILVKPGKTAEATLTLTPGTYTFYCSIPGHRQSGMQGKLIVK